jgi:hypothetical protein
MAECSYIFFNWIAPMKRVRKSGDMVLRDLEYSTHTSCQNIETAVYDDVKVNSG